MTHSYHDMFRMVLTILPMHVSQKKTIRQMWPVHLQGPSEQKPVKIFGEKGACSAWVYPCQIF